MFGFKSPPQEVQPPLKMTILCCDVVMYIVYMYIHVHVVFMQNVHVLVLVLVSCIFFLHTLHVHVYMTTSWYRGILQPCGSLPLSCVFPEPPQTLYLMSDGLYVYWMYSLRAQDSITNPVTGEKIKQFPIYIHQLQVKVLEIT